MLLSTHTSSFEHAIAAGSAKLGPGGRSTLFVSRIGSCLTQLTGFSSPGSIFVLCILTRQPHHGLARAGSGRSSTLWRRGRTEELGMGGQNSAFTRYTRPPSTPADPTTNPGPLEEQVSLPFVGSGASGFSPVIPSSAVPGQSQPGAPLPLPSTATAAGKGKQVNASGFDASKNKGGRPRGVKDKNPETAAARRSAAALQVWAARTDRSEMIRKGWATRKAAKAAAGPLTAEEQAKSARISAKKSAAQQRAWEVRRQLAAEGNSMATRRPDKNPELARQRKADGQRLLWERRRQQQQQQSTAAAGDPPSGAKPLSRRSEALHRRALIQMGGPGSAFVKYQGQAAPPQRDNVDNVPYAASTPLVGSGGSAFHPVTAAVASLQVTNEQPSAPSPAKKTGYSEGARKGWRTRRAALKTLEPGSAEYKAFKAEERATLSAIQLKSWEKRRQKAEGGKVTIERGPDKNPALASARRSAARREWWAVRGPALKAARAAKKAEQAAEAARLEMVEANQQLHREAHPSRQREAPAARSNLSRRSEPYSLSPSRLDVGGPTSAFSKYTPQPPKNKPDENRSRPTVGSGGSAFRPVSSSSAREAPPQRFSAVPDSKGKQVIEASGAGPSSHRLADGGARLQAAASANPASASYRPSRLRVDKNGRRLRGPDADPELSKERRKAAARAREAKKKADGIGWGGRNPAQAKENLSQAMRKAVAKYEAQGRTWGLEGGKQRQSGRAHRQPTGSAPPPQNS